MADDQTTQRRDFRRMTPHTAGTLLHVLILVSRRYQGSSAFSIYQVPTERQSKAAKVGTGRRCRSEHANLVHSSPSTALGASVATSMSDDIPGLLPDKTFARSSKIDSTLRNLRTQLPQTLTAPLTSTSVAETYAADFTLVGPNDEILAAGTDELASLGSTLVAAVGAARRAGELASTLTRNTGSSVVDSEDDDAAAAALSDTGAVRCDLTLDPNLHAVHVSWSTSLPASPIDRRQSAPPTISGTSIFTLDSRGMVSRHRILHVEVDGQSIDAVGEALAGLRRTVRSVRESSPWVEAAMPLLTELGEGILRSSLDGRNDDEVRSGMANLYLADGLVSEKKNATAWKSIGRSDIDSASLDVDGVPIPLPGGVAWSDYASSHRVLSSFVRLTIPMLAGEVPALPDGLSIRELFSSDAKMRAFDGTKLLKGGGRVADLFKTASSLRNTGGVGVAEDEVWTMVGVLANWHNRTVTVRWSSFVQVRVNGTDKFHLNDEGEVELIEQIELIVGGSKIVDSGWVRAIIGAVEGTRGGAGGEIILDVLQKARGRGRQAAPTLGATGDADLDGPVGRVKAPLPLSEAAAASFYNLIRALHVELPSLADSSPNAPPLPPAASYLSESVELRGLLGETLARGVGPYSQAVSVSIGSLRAAVRTGTVKATKEPLPTVEVTAKGTLKVTLMINLRIDAPSPGPDLGIPFNLELTSEYKVNRDGQIVEHCILENKVNGQKSPADVVSAWITGASKDEGKSGAQQQGAVRALLDAVNWARSAGGQ